MRILFSLTFLSLITAMPCDAENTTVIHIDGGNISVATPDKDGIRAYKGLPYAAPPVGELRWREPAPVPEWKSVRAVNQFAPNCLQPKLYTDVDPFTPSMSEDCLYLNVWTKAQLHDQPHESLPVFVWIHGGGFKAGSGSEPRHDGTALAKKGVVVVTINYRLGPFGFLAHPQLTAESSHHASGNYAVMDMIAALRWVQKNIAKFGGNPNCVTIAGESAGSHAVNLLMASPHAKGLFHRAIGESGSGFPVSTEDDLLSNAEANGEKFIKTIGDKSIAQLRKRSSAELLALWMSPDAGWSSGPVIDGWILPSSVENIFKAGKQNDVPLLLGWNADEGNLTANRFGARSLQELLHAHFGDRAAVAAKYYPASNAAEEQRSRFLYAKDVHVAQAMWKWAVTQTITAHAPVYIYQFNHVPPVPDDWFGGNVTPQQAGAFHSGEIVYVFGHADAIPTWHVTADDYKLADEMSSYWARFAATGNPNVEGGTLWPSYNLNDPQRMIFDTPSHVEKDDEAERRKFFDSAPVPPGL
ncbi:MAG: carboxylesterase/lipase family protein [Steroidobacter sp.]